MESAKAVQKLKVDTEIQDQILSDLSKWEAEMRERDANYKSSKDLGTGTKRDLPPVRGSGSKTNSHNQSPAAIHSDGHTEKFSGLSLIAKKQKSEEEKEKGNIFYKQGHLEKALVAYSTAIDADKNNIACYANRALVFLKQRRYKEAEADCSLALRLDPNYVKALHRRGVARMHQKDFENAEKDFEKALVLEPENKTIDSELKAVNRETAKLRETKGEAAKDVKPNVANVNLVTENREVADDPNITVEEYQDYAEEALKWKEKGNKLYESGDVAAAIDCYSNAMALDPAVAIYYSNRGMGYLAMEKYKDAETDCTVAISMDPSHLKSYQRRAVARTKLGKFDEAIADLQKVLSVDSKNKIAKDQLREIRRLLENFKPPQPQEAEDSKISMTSIPVQSVTSTVEETKLVSDFFNRFSPATPKAEEVVKAVQTPSKPVRAAPLVTLVPPAPKNYAQFLMDWKRIKRDEDAKYQYLKQLDGDNLKVIFRESLEPEDLSEILSVLVQSFVPKKHPIFPYLKALPEAKRFKSAAMFLNNEDTRRISMLFTHAIENNEAEIGVLEKVRDFWF